MDDVVFGFVYDFGSNEEWTATRGGGAFLNGDAADRQAEGRDRVPLDRGDARGARARAARRRSRRSTDRVRIMGAQAITFCHLAAGRTDAVVCLKPSRRVDFAAAQLLVRERGFSIHRDRRAAARRDPARPRGALAHLSPRASEELATRLAAGGTLLAMEPSPRRDSRRARERDRPRAAQAGHRARHGPRRRRSRAARCASRSR